MRQQRTCTWSWYSPETRGAFPKCRHYVRRLALFDQFLAWACLRVVVVVVVVVVAVVVVVVVVVNSKRINRRITLE